MAHMTASAEQSSSSLNYNTNTNNNHYNSNNNANNNNVKRKQINEKAFDNDNSLIMKMSVEQWSYNDVAKWLTSIGFEHYANWIAFEHKIDGATLLTLTERDLREKPVEMQCLGDIKHLSNAISSLRNESFIHCSNSKSNLSTCSSSCHLSSRVHLPYANDVNENSNASTLCADHQDGFVPIMNVNHGMYTEPTETSGMNLSSRENASGETRLIQVLTREHLIRQVESADTKNKSLIKLAIAFCYCTFSLLTSAFVMVLVHDRVPDMKTYPPLPDIVLDNLPLIPWAFEVCELIGVVLSSIWFIILFFHKHRIVVMRRMFSLVGTVFLLRCVTMLITSLSVPGVHLECSAKSYGALSAKLSEAYHIWSKLGMSIQGVRTCGDYMFSGHTTAVTLLNHFITEYTPDSWHGLHTMTWVMNLFGIFFILAGHEHYSIDVFIAFYISSRMFLYYHTFAYNHFNSTSSDQRIRIWFPLGWFFEAGGQGRVANEFEFPFSFPIASIFDYCKRFVHSHKLLSCQSNDKLNNKKSVSVDNSNEQQHSLNDDSNPFSVTDHPSRQLKKRKSVKK